MARPIKEGLMYFPFDVDFFNNKKIKSVKARYGGDGIMLYIYLLTEIYRNKGYYLVWDEDSEYNLMDDLHLKKDFIGNVLDFLIDRALIIKIIADNIVYLTSVGVQERYQEAIKCRKRGLIVNPEIWKLSKEDTLKFIKFPNDADNESPDKSGINSDKSEINAVNKIKENKKKVNDIKTKEIDCIGNKKFYDDIELNKTLIDYINYRDNINSHMTDHSIELLINKLDSMTDSVDEKIKILEQSMINGWKDIFCLNNKGKPDKFVNNSSKIKPTRFTNYEEREWDYDELSRIKQAELLKKIM